jgi:hypothetical protein
MESYGDVDGDSNVAAYELGPDWIRVQFRSGAVYLYTAASAGAANIAQMHQLARAGNGLNSFINRYVPKSYARREQ